MAIDLITCSWRGGARRRSEPVHIREAIAEVWAILGSCLPEAREDPHGRPTETAWARLAAGR